jgi:hypothetical protein
MSGDVIELTDSDGDMSTRLPIRNDKGKGKEGPGAMARGRGDDSVIVISDSDDGLPTNPLFYTAPNGKMRLLMGDMIELSD